MRIIMLIIGIIGLISGIIIFFWSIRQNVNHENIKYDDINHDPKGCDNANNDKTSNKKTNHEKTDTITTHISYEPSGLWRIGLIIGSTSMILIFVSLDGCR